MKHEQMQAIKDAVKGVVRVDSEKLFFYNRSSRCWTTHKRNSAAMALQRVLAELKMARISGADAKAVLGDILCDPDFERPLIKVPPNLINLKNGVLDLDSGEFIEGDNAADFRFQLDFEYRKEVKLMHCKAFLKYLRVAFDLSEDMQAATVEVQPSVVRLLEFFGYLVSNETRAKKMMIILGPPNSGKSQLLELLRRVIGETVALNLDELNGRSGGQFRTELLRRAHALINDELPTKGLKGLDELKKTIAGEYMTVEAKREDPGTMKNTAKLIFAGNQLPVLAEPDAGGAFSSRLCVVKLLKAPPVNKRNIDLVDQFYDERNEIFSLAVDLFRKMRGRARALTFSPDAVGDGVVVAYAADNDSVATFVHESGIVKQGGESSTTTLFALYSEYCDQVALKPISDIKIFRSQLLSLPEVCEIKKKRLNGRPMSAVVGLSIVGN